MQREVYCGISVGRARSDSDSAGGWGPRGPRHASPKMARGCAGVRMRGRNNTGDDSHGAGVRKRSDARSTMGPRWSSRARGTSAPA